MRRRRSQSVETWSCEWMEERKEMGVKRRWRTRRSMQMVEVLEEEKER